MIITGEERVVDLLKHYCLSKLSNLEEGWLTTLGNFEIIYRPLSLPSQEFADLITINRTFIQ